MWGLIYRFVLWIPIALAAGVTSWAGSLLLAAPIWKGAKIEAEAEWSWLEWAWGSVWVKLAGLLLVVLWVWLLTFAKRNAEAAEASPLEDVNRRLLSIEETLRIDKTEAPAVPPAPAPSLRQSGVIQPDDATHEHVVGQVPITGIFAAAEEEGDTLSATGVVGIQGLYVGNIIVAAGALQDEHQLEIAVIGFNGSVDEIVIGGIAGHIRAGTGNMRDFRELALPAVQETIRCAPYSEFRLIMYQHVPKDLIQEFIQATLGEGTIGIDLRQLTVKAVDLKNEARWDRLPLWDGVNLRRRDDVVSHRNNIVSVSVVEAVKATATCDATLIRGAGSESS